MDTPRLRSALDQVPAYVAGKPPAAREGLTVYKVSSNESHLPPITSVRDAAVAAMESSNRYPDASAQQLRAEIIYGKVGRPQRIYRAGEPH